MRALVVHSPLVGPATVRPLVAELTRRGWDVEAPDLRHAVASLADFANSAGGPSPKVDVVLGHSGAGAALPLVASRVDARVMVFVDAVVPERAATYRPSERFVAFVDALPVVDGLLPPWHEWWPADAVAELLPEENQRRAIVAEIPHVPRSFYDDVVALPEQWWERAGAYLQLSPAYDDDAARAASWGWPVARIEGHHLDLATRPAEVATAVVSLAADALGRP